MNYRIELTRKDGRRAFDKNEHVNGVAEVKTFLAECVEDDYKVDKIVMVFKNGRGLDVTDRYM